MSKGKGKLSEKDAERRHQIWLKLIDTVGATIRAVVYSVGVVLGLLVAVAMPVYFSAGKETTITYALTWLADVRIEVWLAFGAAGGTTAWALTERRRRFAERAEKDERIAKLERRLDPNRTSSNLTPEGTIDHTKESQ